MSGTRRLPPAIEAMIERARAIRRWAAAPRDIVSPVERIPEQAVTPPVQREINAEDERPLDIRSPQTSASGGLLEETSSDAYLVSRAFDGGELAVAITPPGGDGRWRFQGTLWLHAETTVPSLVSLVQGDHVMASTTLPGGGNFEFDEYLAGAWSIEIHLGDGGTLVIAEPAR